MILGKSVSGSLKSSGAQPAGGHKNGLWNAVCHWSDYLCSLHSHVRRHQSFPVSAPVQGILKMGAGVFMVILGINMLGLFPGLRRFGLRQLEDEKMTLTKEPADLLEIAGAVGQSFAKETTDRGIRLTVEGEQTIVRGDRKRLHQAIYNLVSNAVKYSRDHGTIQISVRMNERMASLSVEDNGIGISEAELPFIFERFYRTDTSRSRKTGGSGVGLTIAKAIIQAHGGSIQAESREGTGSRFTIILPVN